MKKEKLIAALFIKTCVVECAASGTIDVLKPNPKIEKDDDGDYVADGITYLTNGNEIAKKIVSFEVSGVVVNNKYKDRLIDNGVFEGVTVSEAVNKLRKMNRIERTEYLNQEEPPAEKESGCCSVIKPIFTECRPSYPSLIESRSFWDRMADAMAKDIDRAKEIMHRGVSRTQGKRLGFELIFDEANSVQKESPLAGEYPSKDQRAAWLQVLKNAGIVQGVEFRLMDGTNPGKIVKFDNPTFNDLGVIVGEGYALRFDKGVPTRVAKPLYKVVSINEVKDVENVGFIYCYPKESKGVVFYGFQNDGMPAFSATVNEESTEGGTPTCATSFFPSAKDALNSIRLLVKGRIAYVFDSRQDLYEWLSIKEA